MLRKPDTNWNGRCGGVGGQRAGFSSREKHIGIERNQLVDKQGPAVGRAVAIPNLQRRVTSFQIAEIAQAGSKRRNVARGRCGVERRENADERTDRLLRTRRERPRGRASPTSTKN